MPGRPAASGTRQRGVPRRPTQPRTPHPLDQAHRHRPSRGHVGRAGRGAWGERGASGGSSSRCAGSTVTSRFESSLPIEKVAKFERHQRASTPARRASHAARAASRGPRGLGGGRVGVTVTQFSCRQALQAEGRTRRARAWAVRRRPLRAPSEAHVPAAQPRGQGHGIRGLKSVNGGQPAANVAFPKATHAHTASSDMSPNPVSMDTILARRWRPSSSSFGTTSIRATYTKVPAARADTAAPTPPLWAAKA